MSDLFKRVYQETANDCAPAVAAMITGLPLAVVKEQLPEGEHGVVFSVWAGFLLRHGYHVGGFAPGIFPVVSFARQQPAWLVVKSRSGKAKHSVLWNGKRVLDPEPSSYGRKLVEYDVLEWWPLWRLHADQDAGSTVAPCS